ncbi:hypothetical protein LCGC14_1283500 [marine sediment metagenome]|uniref:CR-type domain-containing protein n=1 Tax=marine sediment metagenome TaxID=412755 RepID=A0A0F9NXN4_9ZZZZ
MAEKETYEECGECEGYGLNEVEYYTRGDIVIKLVECPACGGTGKLKLPTEEPGKLNPAKEMQHQSRHREH